MTWLSVLALAKKVPALAWLVVLMAGAGAVLYRRGQASERHKVEQAARIDTTRHAVVQLRQRKESTTAVITRAAETRPATIATGVTRQQFRAAVTIVDSQTVRIAGLLDTLPLEVVSLIRADDAKIAADSVHVMTLEQLVPAALKERAAAAAVDTARVHESVCQAPRDHSRATIIAITSTVLVAALAILNLLR